MCSPVIPFKSASHVGENRCVLPLWQVLTRLNGYDYSQNGAYFITICVEKRKQLFGKIIDDTMQPNQAGEMVAYWWSEIVKHFSGIDIDVFTVMPNHFHGILVLYDNAEEVSVI